MCAPLFDEWGAVRYHLGAQIDVSAVVADAPELESLQRTVARAECLPADASPGELQRAADAWRNDDAFQSLVEMLDMQELQAIRAWEERLLRAAGGAQERTGTAGSDDSGIGRSEKGREPEQNGLFDRERRPGLPLKPRQPTASIRGMHFGLYDKVGRHMASTSSPSENVLT